MSLINELPYIYHFSGMKEIQDSLSIEADNVNTEIEDTLNQMFLDSATSGLDKWESMIGINKNTLDLQVRRENIKAKMRSRGTSSLNLIKSICEAYSYGEVDIIMDYENYSFTIDFIGTIGVPKGFAEMDKVIEDIKPCHLRHLYNFNYNTHSDVSKFTHDELTKYTYDEIRNLSELRSDNKWLRNT